MRARMQGPAVRVNCSYACSIYPPNRIDVFVKNNRLRGGNMMHIGT